jgi:hypothetical protein
MLEKLDTIAWKDLPGGRGPSTAVPELVRRAASAPSGEVATAALAELMGHLIAKGSVPEVTPHALPFLVELLEDGIPAEPKVQSVLRRTVLLFLRMFLLAGEEEEGPWVAAARAAVVAGTPRYLELLADTRNLEDLGRYVRIRAAQLLCRIDERRDEILPRLEERRTREQYDEVKAAFFLAADRLHGEDVPEAYLEKLERETLVKGSPWEKLFAAFSLLSRRGPEAPAAAAAALLEALAMPGDAVESIYREVAWVGRTQRSFYRDALSLTSHLGPDVRARAVAATAPRLARADGPGAVQLGAGLLVNAFDEPGPKGPPKPLKASSLTKPQREVLEALSRCDAFWRDADADEITEILAALGLPAEQKALAKFVGGGGWLGWLR